MTEEAHLGGDLALAGQVHRLGVILQRYAVQQRLQRGAAGCSSTCAIKVVKHHLSIKPRDRCRAGPQQLLLEDSLLPAAQPAAENALPTLPTA